MLAEPDTDSLLPTRQSLLSRLRDWQDQDGWREFFDSYWRLIYNVARKSGLGDAEAQDVVQTTFMYPLRPGARFFQVLAARRHSLAHQRVSAKGENWRQV